MWYKMSSVEILCSDIVVFLMENHNYKYLVEIIFNAQFSTLNNKLVSRNTSVVSYDCSVWNVLANQADFYQIGKNTQDKIILKKRGFSKTILPFRKVYKRKKKKSNLMLIAYIWIM